ncbi:HET-domain-containing protein, partial [Byssothecium circinans]
MSVIDCETRLVQSLPPESSYFALSYVWGPPLQCEEPEYPNLPRTLPRTIEDAITVTSQLGYRYLWVDRYCINQKDTEHKMSQIQQMGAIYYNAALTIVAAAGDDPTYGLAGVSHPRNFSVHWGSVEGVILVDTTSPMADKIGRSTWAQRAWTFQEGYLSRRRLFFTEDGVLFVHGQG